MTNLDVTVLDGVTGGVNLELCRKYDRIADALNRNDLPLTSHIYRQQARECRADRIGAVRRWLGL